MFLLFLAPLFLVFSLFLVTVMSGKHHAIRMEETHAAEIDLLPIVLSFPYPDVV
jgi:hypothetical protein